MQFRVSFRSLLALSVLAIASLLGFACDDGEEAPGQTATQEAAGAVKIALATDLTGPQANPIRLSEVAGVRAAVKQINDRGGFEVGGKRYRFDLMEVDTRSDAVAAVAGAQQVIEQKAIMAWVSAASFDQMYGQLRPANIITTAFAPTAGVILAREAANHPFLFFPIDTTAKVIEGWEREVKAVFPQIQRVATLTEDSPFGLAVSSSAEAGAKLLGLEYVGTVLGPADTTDWSTFITNLRARNPELVYVTGSRNLLEMTTQSVQAQLARVLMSPGVRVADVPKLGNLGNISVVLADFRTPYNKGLAPNEVLPALESLGTLPGGGAIQVGPAIAGYDFINLLVRAMQQAGTVTDTTAIARALVGQSYEGPFGRVRILDNHTTRGTTGIIVVTQNDLTLHVFDDVEDATPNSSLKVSRSQILP